MEDILFFVAILKPIAECYPCYCICVAMWRSCLQSQSGNPEVVGLSPACGEKLAVAELSQDRFIRGFYLWPRISPRQGDKLGTR